MPIHGWQQHETPPVFRCRTCGIEVATKGLIQAQHRWEREHKAPYPIGLVRPTLDLLAGLVPCKAAT